MVLWFALLSVMLAAELVIAGSLVSAVFPPKLSPLADHFFTLYRNGFVPERDVFFLRVLIAAATGTFFLLMVLEKKILDWGRAKIKALTAAQAVFLFLQVFFYFKFALFHYPVWLNALYASLTASVLVKVFWPECFKLSEALCRRLSNPLPLLLVDRWLPWAAAVAVAAVIWVPDMEAAVARMFVGEQCHHMDWLLTAAGWAHISGNVLGVDTLSRYGIGAPVVVSELDKLLTGRFDYVSALGLVMLVSVAYYWIWLYALKRFFGNSVWAVLALMLGLRLQLFHLETFPFIFTYPQVTPLRFFFDGVFFLCLIEHVRSGKPRWLFGAAAAAGYAIFHITGEGVYITATFYTLLILREWYVRTKGPSQLKALSKGQWILLAVFPWAVMVFCMALVVGGHVLNPVFWTNQIEYIRYYDAGNSSAPMINNLTVGFVLQAGIAFVLPVVYVFVLMTLLGFMARGKLKEEGLVLAAAAAFLLVSLQYHAQVSNNTTAYLRNGVILSFLAAACLRAATERWGLYHQRLGKLFLGLALVFMTVTTHQFLLHPNMFNLSRNPMSHPVVSQNPPGRSSYFNHLFVSYPDAFKLPVNGLGETDEKLLTEKDFSDDGQLKRFFREESDYSKDADLIRSLTKERAQVPVISSFENMILMQAKRRPFFYTYFLVNSQPRRMRKFPVTVLYTGDSLQREIRRLETQKPAYVFIERTFLVSPIPQSYLYDNQDLIALLNYVLAHYHPDKVGEFLVALKYNG